MSSSDSKIVRETTVKSEDRSSRASENSSRENENGTALTMAERIAILRDEYTGDILPDVSKSRGIDPEMHYFWASTTNQTDPIYKRLRMGYELVRADELPELATEFRISSGQYEGCISVNEMILLKIPKVLANELMKINHHERPLAEEQRVQDNAVVKQEDREGKKLGGFDEEDEGFKHIVNHRRDPKTFV